MDELTIQRFTDSSTNDTNAVSNQLQSDRKNSQT